MQVAPWRIAVSILLFVNANVAKALTLGRRCFCSVNDLSVLQRHVEHNRRPDDCACITGMTTYPTTPRDELLGMGKAALGNKLHSCEQRRQNLGEQRDYAVKESETQREKMDREMSQARNSLESLRNSSKEERSSSKSELQDLQQQVQQLEATLGALKGDYDAQFSEWYGLNKELSAKLAKLTAGCGTCASTQVDVLILKQSTKPLLLQTDPDSDYMYETAHKVEKCEMEVQRLGAEKEQADAEARHAAIAVVDNKASLERRLANQQRLHKVLSSKPRLEAMRSTQKLLLKSEQDQKQRIEKYQASNRGLHEQLEKLVSKLKECGCNQ